MKLSILLIYILKTNVGMGIIEPPNTLVIQNVISNCRILDWTTLNVVRTGIKIGGGFNSITNTQMFNDGPSGTFYCFDFTR